MIEIPGYRIVRQLGSGGMSTVHLAIQESVDREVALKVMTPALAADPRYSERFLREARIAAKLHHRHVVGIHDVGRDGDHHFIAMEYVSGGTIAAHANPGNVPFVLRVLREIATALSYAHGKGVVHRDVKPDNILLREDGAAALTDFGIARAADAMSSMTRTGSVIGTPHYMSPEQARGQPLDGRADLYSLGIVLYELLVGHVPYQADDPLAVGIKHLTEPVPILPDLLSPLQPLLDGLMAKEPEQRFQDAASVAAALESIEAAILAGELPSLGSPEDVMLPPVGQRMTPPFTPRIATPVPRTPAPELRAEPVLGEISAADIDRPKRRRRTASASRARRWPWLLLVVLAFGVWAFLEQDRLRALIPRTELNVLLVDAERALAEGRLHGDADSAEALYRAVLEIEPDHDVARSGMRKVTDAQVAHARESLRAGDLAAARDWLRAARASGAAPAVLGDIEAALREADGADQARGEGLQAAREAAAAGRIEGADDAAVPMLLALLERYPGDSAVEAELDRLAGNLLDDVAARLAAEDDAGARARLDSVAAWRPRHPGLVHARAAVAAVEEGRRADLDRLISEGDARLRRGRLTTPAGNSALDAFREVLARAPDHQPARAGVRRVAVALAGQADRALGDLDLDRAQALIEEAATLAPDLAQLAALRQRLKDAGERAAIAVQPLQLGEVQRFERDRLLALAQAAEEAGQLMYPPGDSAYDRYRAVLALDPAHAEAMAGMQRLPDVAARRADEALADGRLNAARGFVEGLGQLAPLDARLPALRRRTADALLENAVRGVAAGQRQSAAQALDAAAELDPAHPRLDEVSRLVRGD